MIIALMLRKTNLVCSLLRIRRGLALVFFIFICLFHFSGAQAHANHMHLCESVFVDKSLPSLDASERGAKVDTVLTELAQLKVDIETARSQGQMELARVLYGSLEKRLQKAQQDGLPVHLLTTYIERAQKTHQEQAHQEKQLIETAESNETISKPWTSVLLSFEASMYKSFEFSPDGKYFFATDDDHAIATFDARTGKEEQKFSTTSGLGPTTIMSADGRFTAMIPKADPPVIMIWNNSTGQLEHALKGHKPHHTSLAISSDGRFVATGNEEGKVFLWDTTSPRKKPVKLKGHEKEVETIAFSPDGKFMATASEDKTIRFWDIAKGELIRELRGLKKPADHLILTSSQHIVCKSKVSDDVFIWNPNTDQFLTLVAHQKRVRSFAVNRDEKLLVTGDDDGVTIVWDLETGKKIRALETQPSSVQAIAISPDSQYVVLGIHKAISVLYLENGLKVNEAPAHNNYIAKIAFSPDGQSFITGTWDSSLLLWRRDHENTH